MKEITQSLLTIIVCFATEFTVQAQTEEETLVWLNDYGRNLSATQVYTHNENHTEPYVAIFRYSYMDKENDILIYNETIDLYDKEQRFSSSIYPSKEVKGADLQFLYLKPVDNAAFSRTDKETSYYKYDAYLDGNKRFTGEKVAYYTYHLEFSKNVVQYYETVNTNKTHVGQFSGFTLYFTNLEDAQRVIKAINHLAKLKGAKPKPQVKKETF